MPKSLEDRRAYAKSWREKNKDKTRQYYRSFCARHPDYKREHYLSNADGIKVKASEYYRTKGQTPSGKLIMYKAQAKHRRMAFLLSRDDFMSFWQKDCHYCGDPILTIGLDRVDNSIGYQMGNVVSCCCTCNRAKLQMSEEDFFSMCRKVASRHGSGS